MFTKGNKDGKGRPKGAVNKTTGLLREMITDFLFENFEKVKKDFLKLQPKERAKLYCDLLPYRLPKLQATSIDFNLERLTDEQLNEIIEQLKNTANEK